MSRVMHVISGLGMGGAERNLAQIAIGLAGRGIAQHVVCVGERGLWADGLAAHGVPVDVLGVTQLPGFAAGVVRLARLVGHWQPSVLQGWMPHGNLMAALAHRPAAGRHGRRLFWNLRASNIREASHRRLIRLTALLSAWPDGVIANSQAGLEFHVSQGYRPRRTEVIGNGIDTGQFWPDPAARSAVRGELGIAETDVVAVHVARLDPMKDHATFFAAMRSCPQTRGLMIGTGTETLNAPANVRGLGLRQDVERFYAGADIVVSSSAYAEGFSNAVAEGMSAGLVPVATDVGDARHIVGDAGRIVAVGDAVGMAKAIADEAALPDPERRARGARARERIVQQFSLDRALDRYASLYA